MAFLEEKDLHDAQTFAEQDAKVWMENYPEYRRLANNEIIEGLDENLPEVNDGTLAASLLKLPKRIVNKNLVGQAKAVDSDIPWVSELANVVWEEEIVPNANTGANFHRKWKHAVRTAATYGHAPLITLFVENGNYIGADFIVAQPGDVLVEAGAVSDYDSSLFFWDVYYSKSKLENLIERAETEMKDGSDGVNKWNIPELKKILKEFPEEEAEPKNDTKEPRQKGVKFTVVFQRGVNAPFYMKHGKKTVREWSNPDPSGDVPVHFLYCYQDLENPYGIGIVKLAGGTQNTLDLLRQSDTLATQIGIRPPISIAGQNITGLDRDTLIYAQDAQWEVGTAQVRREEISNQVYSQLPARISMYKTSLNQLIPVGDTSISASDSGDPQYSKTPAGVKFQQANLSIDDDDFKDNLYLTYEAKARSMLNTHFANMQGHDLIKLSDEKRDLLAKSGIEFPMDEEGNPATNELDIIWDEARAQFTFEIDAEQDAAKDDEQRLEGLMKVAEMRSVDPMFDQRLSASGKKINDGELYATIIQLTTDNDKIIEDISPEEKAGMEQEQMMAAQEAQIGQQMPQEMPEEVQEELPMDGQQDQQMYVQQLMEAYGVDEPDAMAMAEAESLGYSTEEILSVLQKRLTNAN